MRATFVRLVQTLRDGVSLFWLAPVIVALIVVPEFIQHVAEIRIGMFDSKEAFRAMADDPRRMVWGYLKLAGLLLAILAATRFWGARSRGEKWWDLRTIAWANLALALVLVIVTGIPSMALGPAIGDDAAGIVGVVISIATLPLIALLVAGLVGDRQASLKSVFRTGWLASLRILVFAAVAWVPLQWLHGKNHDWALGADSSIVWSLMIFDALVVGLLAAIAGTAFHHGYEADRLQAEPS
ncbi:MAG: hypothetical protein WBH10_00150 [Allopontixanthobacter sediminis]